MKPSIPLCFALPRNYYVYLCSTFPSFFQVIIPHTCEIYIYYLLKLRYLLYAHFFVEGICCNFPLLMGTFASAYMPVVLTCNYPSLAQSTALENGSPNACLFPCSRRQKINVCSPRAFPQLNVSVWTPSNSNTCRSLQAFLPQGRSKRSYHKGFRNSAATLIEKLIRFLGLESFA